MNEHHDSHSALTLLSRGTLILTLPVWADILVNSPWDDDDVDEDDGDDDDDDEKMMMLRR